MEGEAKKTCALCNREGALAVFGILLGLVFIGMGVDVIRRSRMSTVSTEEVEPSDD